MKPLVATIFLLTIAVAPLIFFAWKKSRMLSIITNAGGIICFEHEWDSKSNTSSGVAAPGGTILKKLLGEYFFATPREVVIGVGTAIEDGKGWQQALSEIRSLTSVNIVRQMSMTPSFPFL